MTFWKNLFRTSRSAPASPDPEEVSRDNMAVALGAATQGRSRLLVRDAGGQAIGFWFAQLPGTDLAMSLRVIAVAEKLDVAAYISIRLGDYRIVPNSFDGRGGTFVMIGPARAPGEPIASLESVRWRKGEANPKSDLVVRFTEGVKGVRFSCPTCRLPNYCYDSDMAVEAGAMVSCGHCGNISHVPAAYTKQEDTSGLEIRGCAYVPIADFGDWFFNHPSYSSECTEDLGSYGLWAYCAACKHQFPSTVLVILPVASQVGSLLFNAKSPSSAKDMQGLLDHQCPECGHTDLLAVMIDIPGWLRERISSQRRTPTRCAIRPIR